MRCEFILKEGRQCSATAGLVKLCIRHYEIEYLDIPRRKNNYRIREKDEYGRFKPNEV
jgi:hypothetical protein